VSNLSEADLHDTDDERLDAPKPVEIRRNGALSGGIGAVATVVALAYLTRALGGGSFLDWVLALVMGAVAAAYLMAFADARTPLLVADTQGIRIRLGRSWRGVPWEEIEAVEHLPRRGPLRDGRVDLVVADPEALLEDLDAAGRRQVAIARRLHGSPFAIPLSLSTWVSGAADLTLALDELSGDPDRIIDLGDYQAEDEWAEDDWADEGPVDATDEWDDDEPADEWDEPHPVLPDPRPTLARGLDFLADRLRLGRPSQDDALLEDAPEPTVALPMVASATPLPLRDPVGGSRVEARFEGAAALKLDTADVDDTSATGLPELGELRRAGEFEEGEFEETVVWAAGVHPISRAGDAVEPLVIDDLPAEPADDPVIGPELAAARTRLGLTVDQLAERTRIRPHVIESVEVDDFVPCGGDFYARGHLRTLARVLGVDAAPLLASYDDRYSDAPIDARRVFEAELATGAEGPIRSMRGGPNWSVLIAAVMALVLIWSIARLIMDNPVELTSKPVLNGSPSSQTKLGPAVPVLLDATAGGTHVVVRDGAGEVVFNGDLAYGEKRSVKAAPPVQVQSSDGALQVTIDSQKRGPLGAEGQPAQNTYAASAS
jgi:transcriptional regulator with XRE-family HTH domain